MSIAFPRSMYRSKGFTLMEILVVIAIILVLAAIAFPVYTTVQQRAGKAAAINTMKQLAAATQAYVSQNDGELPSEDAKGTDNWNAAADPENAKAWYNALPKVLGARTVGDFAKSPREYYTKANLLFLPGAGYPATDKKLTRPLFAVAINTKLQRKDSDGKKPPAKVSQISSAGRTVIFLEQGLPDEKKSVPTQSKYDGSCKGSARSFVGRYGGQGSVCFVDGHVELYDPKDLLTEEGRFPFPVEGTGTPYWTRTAEEDPNK